MIITVYVLNLCVGFITLITSMIRTKAGFTFESERLFQHLIKEVNSLFLLRPLVKLGVH